VIALLVVSLSPALSTTRTVTVQVPGAGAVAEAVMLPAGEWISNPGLPSRSQSVPVIGLLAFMGVDVEMIVTMVPATTGFGAQSKSAVGWAMATPIPSGDTTAPTVAKQAVSSSLT
jgi:hypothetical protein